MGGHFVTGHIDGIGKIAQWEQKGEDRRIKIFAPNEVMRYVVRKGAIAIDGISLTVAEVAHSGKLSRITIVTNGPPAVIDQIKAQLERMVPVHAVLDLTVEGRAVERELALIKDKGGGEKRVEALRLAAVIRDNVVDSTL